MIQKIKLCVWCMWWSPSLLKNIYTLTELTNIVIHMKIIWYSECDVFPHVQTLWSAILPEKPTVAQLVIKFPQFHSTWGSISVYYIIPYVQSVPYQTISLIYPPTVHIGVLSIRVFSPKILYPYIFLIYVYLSIQLTSIEVHSQQIWKHYKTQIWFYSHTTYHS